MEAEKQAFWEEQQNLVKKYEDMLASQRIQHKEIEVRAEELERQLDRSRQEEQILRAELEDAHRQTEEVSRKLAELDKTQAMFTANSREEQLEQELRRLKRQAQKGGNTDETQALKKELMEYVRFILKLLPGPPANMMEGFNPKSPGGGRALPPLKASSPYSMTSFLSDRSPPGGRAWGPEGGSSPQLLDWTTGTREEESNFQIGAAQQIPARPTEPASGPTDGRPRRPTSRRSGSDAGGLGTSS